MVHEGVFEISREQLSSLYFAVGLGFLLFTDLLSNLNLGGPAELTTWHRENRHLLAEE